MPRKSTKTRPRQGMQLAELRKAAGLSQYELARYVGISQANIAFWERSEKPPRSDVLPKMAEALGVSLEDLLNVNAGKTAARKQLRVTAGGQARCVRSSIASQSSRAVSRSTSSTGSPPTSLITSKPDKANDSLLPSIVSGPQHVAGQ
ncbi:MAG: helix-turn-helix domain-containing protein [Pyrinomonadaceae bacterium]